MRSRYKILDNSQIYFITSTILDWIPIFTKNKYFDIIIHTIKYYQNEKNLKIYAYVILDNHFHFILSCPEVTKTVSSIKMYTAKKIIEELKIENNHTLLSRFKSLKKEYKTKSTYQIWQEGFHPQLMDNYKVLKQKIEYIHYNPVERGFIENIEDWKYSSAKDYYTDQKGLLQIDKII